MGSGCTEEWNASLEQYLAKNIIAKRLVLLSRKRFKCDQYESSVHSKNPDSSNILYFEPFKWQPIILNTEDKIWIYPVFLAKAFLQGNVYDTAKELSSAIFTQEDLNGRNNFQKTVKVEETLDLNRILDTLPPIKIEIIEKLTKWIVEKQYEPWVISPEHLKQVPQCTQAETKEIDRAFCHFDKISDPREYGIPPSEISENERGFEQWLFDNSVEMEGNDYIAPLDVIHEGTPQQLYFQRICENWDYEHIFKQIIYEMNKGSLSRCPNVDIVRALTLATVPHCDDFFSGATQLTKNRMSAARRYLTRNGPAQAADKLFRKFRFDFEKKTFNDVDTDLCPIKFFDITRAIAKLMGNDTMDNQNRFLPLTTNEEIKAYLNEKYKGKRYNPKTGDFEFYCCNETNSGSTIGPLNGQCENIEEEIMEVVDDGVLGVPLSTDNNDGAAIAWSVNLPIVVDSDGNILVGQIEPQTARVNYRFDNENNMILSDFGVTLEVQLWKDALKLQGKNTKARYINSNEVRGKYLYDLIFTSEEKLSHISDSNYPSHKKDAILGTLAILNALSGESVEMGIYSCPQVHELTDDVKEPLKTHVFISWANYQRRKLRNLNDENI